ncbi:thioredoxin family protein [Desulfobulbus alkaliphilus]|uniref:thioredoxin family protein n=1 Tax=Desulfobulbus alkaliphilus TaxID=869814 RepID=UPI0019650FC9|nr:thioredoxin domain-containing protein [Desulfobulbus alkaliphilus]MBM9535847.1 thiol reductase thioredoxin [Desulfobulbus alkaliphilus]
MSMLMICPGCGVKNRIPTEKKHLSPKCGRCGTSLAGAPISGIVNPLTDAQFQQRVEQSAMPVLVDMYAPTCGPCQMIAPVIAELAEAFAGRLMVYKLDTSSQGMTASRLRIRGVPTLLFYKNGVMVDQLVGAAPQAQIEARIKTIL